MKTPQTTPATLAEGRDEEGPCHGEPDAFERLEQLVGGEVELTPREGVARIDGVVIGLFVARDPSGRPLVQIPYLREHGAGEACLAALALCELDDDLLGRTLALQFIDGDPRRPVILGPLLEPEPAPEPDSSRQAEDEGVHVLDAERKLTLRCGEASLVLTADGKVLIRGTYVSSRSSGMQRIRGGSVCIN